MVTRVVSDKLNKLDKAHSLALTLIALVDVLVNGFLYKLNEVIS